MSVEKGELKIAVLHELGCKLDDLLEEQQREVHRTDGAAAGLVQAAKAVEALQQLVDDDLNKDRFDLPTANKVKEYIARAAMQVANMAQNARNGKLVATGRVEGTQQAVAVAKKQHDAEIQKRIAHETPPKNGRATGTRPGPTIKQQRAAAPKPPTPTKRISMKRPNAKNAR